MHDFLFHDQAHVLYIIGIHTSLEDMLHTLSQVALAPRVLDVAPLRRFTLSRFSQVVLHLNGTLLEIDRM